MRTNTLKTFVPHNYVYENLDKIEIVPSLDHVGRSSWRVRFDIFTESNKLIANVRTTMVATNDDHDASIPLPNRDALKTMVTSTSSPFTMLPFIRPSSSTFNSTWQSTVRFTDCDSLGHINNSIYPLLCEDARSYGMRSGEYRGKAKSLASCPTSFCQVSYINQAKPFETLRITSHLVNEEHFHFEVVSADVVVAEVIVGVDTTTTGSKL